MKFHGGFALALREQRGIALGRIRQQLGEDIEQLGDACAILGRHEAHRNEMALAQRFLEWRMQLLGRDLALVQVERHQLLVDLHDLVDQRAVRIGDRRKIRFAGRIEKTIDDALAVAGRKVDRQALLAECRADRGEDRRQVDVLGIDLVDDQQAAKSARRRPLHHSRRDHFDARRRVDDDRRGLDSIEGADRLADEVGKSGRVDDVHARVLRLEVKHRGPQRVLPAPFERLEVTDGRAALDAADRLDRSRLVQQRFDQRGLARCAVPDQRQRANVGGGEFRHECHLLLGTCGMAVLGTVRALVAATAILPCSAGAALAALPRHHSNLRPLPAAVKAPFAARKQRGRIVDAPSLDSGPMPDQFACTASSSRRLRSNSSSW